MLVKESLVSYRLNDSPRLFSYIRKKLKKKWSPRQIAQELEIDYPEDKGKKSSLGNKDNSEFKGIPKERASFVAETRRK